MWLASMTRLDIADVVRSVARCCHDPAVSHWKAVMSILPWIAGTVDSGLVYKRRWVMPFQCLQTLHMLPTQQTVNQFQETIMFCSAAIS